MDIQSIQYQNPEGTQLKVTTSDGPVSVPWPCSTWHREPIQEWLDAGGVIDPFPAATEAERRTAEKARIDEAAGRARSRLVSPGDLVVHEYKIAAEEAAEFKAAGYPSADVPPAVQSWADAANLTPTEAADDILATEVNWRGAANQIRGIRLEGKAAVAGADPSQIESTADTYVAQLDAIG